MTSLNLSCCADVTIILTVWRRNNLREQLVALSNQTKQAKEIWVYQGENFVDAKFILADFPGVEHIHSSINLKYYGRFSIALHVNTKYVWILDDDQIPSPMWLEICLGVCESKRAIVSSAGRLIPENNYVPEEMSNVSRYFFGDVPSSGNANFCHRDSIVDFGCNGWLFEREWLNYFWESHPYTFEISEDMHLSAMCKIKAGIPTIVPAQSSTNNTGNLKIEYGNDEHASWTKPGFLEKRTDVLHYLIDDLGWRPVLWKQSISSENFQDSFRPKLSKLFSRLRGSYGIQKSN